MDGRPLTGGEEFPPVPPEPSDLPPTRVRLGTLVAIRWMAVAGQALTLLLVRYGLGFEFSVAAPLLAVAASAGFNLWLSLRQHPARQLADSEAAVHLGLDLGQLGLLLHLTGGMTNPFAFLMLVPVTISATVLSRRSTFLLLALALFISFLIALSHRPLPWRDGPLDIPETYLIGVWVSLTFSMVFLALYAERVAYDARRHVNALAATQAALAREQKLSGLGTLAAAAAHELGTPLGTITLATRDLLRNTCSDDPRHDDLQLIDSQVRRCRRILEQLGDRAIDEAQHPFAFQPLEALVREAARPFENLTDVAIHIEAGPERAEDGSAQPVIRRRDEILHALTNFIENAVGFANDAVTVRIVWSTATLGVTISDDGPGFDPAIQKRLGEPYVSLRGEAGDAGGLGLGVFIAKTLLERTGASVKFINPHEGGARVTVIWPRAAIEHSGAGA